MDWYLKYNTKQKLEYINVKGFRKDNHQYIILYKKWVCKEIWAKLDGLSEKEWNNNLQIICPNCKYQAKTIIELMGKQKKSLKSIDSIKPLKFENRNLIYIKDLITFNLSGVGINFPVSYKKTDKFLFVENKFLKEYPEFKNKNIYYMNGGEVINKNLSIEENRITNADNILFNENIMNDEDTMVV